MKEYQEKQNNKAHLKNLAPPWTKTISIAPSQINHHSIEW